MVNSTVAHRSQPTRSNRQPPQAGAPASVSVLGRRTTRTAASAGRRWRSVTRDAETSLHRCSCHIEYDEGSVVDPKNMKVYGQDGLRFVANADDWADPGSRAAQDGESSHQTAGNVGGR
jgi:hypothetical protein